MLRRPDIYRCGVAGAPVTDWALYDTAYTERYLGLPEDAGDVYAHHSLLESAAEPVRPGEPARPLLLIHGLVDDNVVAAHTLRLSAALLGRRPAARDDPADRRHPHGRRRTRRATAPPRTRLHPRRPRLSACPGPLL